MAKLITTCPSCQTGTVRVSKIECENCRTKFEGEFEVPKLLRLSAEDVQFVEMFVLSSGSLKDMAQHLNVSYPTVRNRLNSIIDDLEKLNSSSKSDREKVLEALEKGTITAKEAARKLRGE